MYVGPPRHLAGLPQPARALVMGVLNVTPDSFSDGGRWADTDAALAHGRRLVAEGADLVDVGGESTRPGATRPSVQEELDRVLPVITRLAAEDVLVSVDTMRAEVAAAALDAGAVLVNDVSGGRADPDMFGTVAGAGAPYVLMHWRAHSAAMQQQTDYTDVVEDVATELADQNWDVLAATERYHALGHPLLVAASRKRFLGTLLADADGTLRPPVDRDDATTATTALAAVAGAWCIRAHAVRPTADAVRVAARWARQAARPPTADSQPADSPAAGSQPAGSVAP